MTNCDARALAALACMTACAVGPDFERPAPPRVARYTADGMTRTIAADGVTQLVRPGAQVADTWWQLFGSKPLDELVRLALANNQDLHAARANLRRSMHNLRAGYGVFLPQIDANAGAVRQRFNAARFGASAPPSIFTLYTLGGTINYTLDVFGGNRRRVEALRAQVDVQCFSLVAAHLTVTGNVVNTAIARAAYAEQIRATEELVADLQKQVDIARVQAQAGTVPYSTVLSFETQLANTAATIPPLRQQLVDAEALLSTLLGYAPAEWRPARIALTDFTLPRELPVSLPATLVRQRPDVLIAESALHVTSANIGVATAAMLPTFSLGVSAGSESKNLDQLFSYGNFVWSFAANVLAPIFHGGTLNAQRKAAIEDFRSALATYRQTVLDALRDVAITLEGLAHDAQAVDARQRALHAATEVRKLVTINYQNGVAGYLDVLVADAQYRQARLGYIQAHARRLQDTVSLFIALGGGWWQRGYALCAEPLERREQRR
jgi:NodT family efflux transporter outer membrane factor (OMF) lipoprotein